MRKSLWVILIAVALVATSCGPAMPPTTSPKLDNGQTFMLALPRIAVDFDESGAPSLLGMSIQSVGKMFGQDLSAVAMPKMLVDWMMAAGVQHIETRQTGDSMALLVNGKPLPHVGWSDASLQQAMDLAGVATGQNFDIAKKVLPIMRRLGLDVVLNFPVAPGAAKIPYADESVVLAPPEPSKDPASVIVRLDVVYDEQGVPSVLGLSGQDLAAMGLNVPLAIAPATLQQLQAKNIQHIQLRTQPDGLFVYVNGNPLPNLVWDNKLLGNTADVYTQMNPQSPVIDLVKQLVPALGTLDINVVLDFPVPAGVAPIPVKG